MPQEHIGEWHTITATADEDGLDFEVTHLPTCPTRDDVVEPWACDLQSHFDGFGYHESVDGQLAGPGVYRARFRLWQIPLAPHVASYPEWDCRVEVEAVSSDA